MATGDPVSCLLWLSQLAPSSDLLLVKQIWRAARQRNESLGVTGAMVFDGERFCELIEGHDFDISAVYRDVEFDPRHVGLRVLHTSQALGPRRLAHWRSGYCEASELDVFTGVDGLLGEVALKAFLALLPRCALEP
jgi:hypothetical protein